jgi:hypothetical protein
MDLLKHLGGFFGWLSGIVAGVTATLYAIGFIASLARQRMLGLDWGATSQETLWYLGLGGQVASRWAFLATVWLLLVIAVGESFIWALRRISGWERRELRFFRSAALWLDRQLIWLIALVATLFTGLMMNAFDGALQVSGLLFAGAGEICTGGGVVGDLVTANDAALTARADTVAGFAALALGTGAYAVPRLLARHGPALPMLLCGAVAFQALAAIPTAHGIFLFDARLHDVDPQGGGPAGDRAGALSLVARVRDGIWLWEPSTGDMHWIAEEAVSGLRVGAPRSIRSLACRQACRGVPCRNTPTGG